MLFFESSCTENFGKPPKAQKVKCFKIKRIKEEYNHSFFYDTTKKR